jgi:hypothetical protein
VSAVHILEHVTLGSLGITVISFLALTLCAAIYDAPPKEPVPRPMKIFFGAGVFAGAAIFWGSFFYAMILWMYQ